jgi:hypothetical protein
MSTRASICSSGCRAVPCWPAGWSAPPPCSCFRMLQDTQRLTLLQLLLPAGRISSWRRALEAVERVRRLARSGCCNRSNQNQQNAGFGLKKRVLCRPNHTVDALMPTQE